MRSINLQNVFNCVRLYGPLTKRDIQHRTRLSWGTVSNLTAELVGKGLFAEEKTLEYAAGRVPMQLDINSAGSCIIGVDLDIAGLTLVVIDLKCRILHQRREAIVLAERDALLQQTIDLISKVFIETEITRDRVLGIGVAMQGSVDAVNGVSTFVPFLQGWNQVPLRAILQARFGLPISVVHDPVCMAMAEKWVGCAKQYDHFVLVRLSDGIGLGIFANGAVYSGFEGAAGELGHLVVEPNGLACKCGSQGCLAMYASMSGILHRIQAGSGKSRRRRQTTLSAAIAMARAGDPFCVKVFQEAGFYLGVALAGVVNLLNPQVVVLAGEMLECMDLFYPNLCTTFQDKRWSYSSSSLQISSVEHSAAVGAAIDIVQNICGDGLDRLLKSIQMEKAPETESDPGLPLEA
jgi:predicted NBD/HSP70 family sugar kinase